MKIVFAGVNHFDPLCRGRLEDWLTSLSPVMPAAPEFVALEWDRDHFAEVRASRAQFSADVSAAFPQLTRPDLDTMAEALGFEGDAHEQFFPDTPAIWMNEGRRVRDYAADRLNLLRSVLIDQRIALDDPGVFQHWCRILREVGQPDGVPDPWGLDRDGEKTDVVRRHVVADHDRWALVIIGANHTVCGPNWMCGKLAAEDHTCLTHGVW
jgi:hypothetical protein